MRLVHLELNQGEDEVDGDHTDVDDEHEVVVQEEFRIIP